MGFGVGLRLEYGDLGLVLEYGAGEVVWGLGLVWVEFGDLGLVLEYGAGDVV